jgi:hypothetical protein
MDFGRSLMPDCSGSPCGPQRQSPPAEVQEAFDESLVRPRRFELLTYSFGGCRSIQLSYGRMSLA